LLKRLFYRCIFELLAEAANGQVLPILIIQPIGRKRIAMNDVLFNELLGSIREGSEILRGEKNASHTFTLIWGAVQPKSKR
jgi:hypothetical protein